jgi:hypothetical protein
MVELGSWELALLGRAGLLACQRVKRQVAKAPRKRQKGREGGGQRRHLLGKRRKHGVGYRAQSGRFAAAVEVEHPPRAASERHAPALDASTQRIREA